MTIHYSNALYIFIFAAARTPRKQLHTQSPTHTHPTATDSYVGYIKTDSVAVSLDQTAPTHTGTER